MDALAAQVLAQIRSAEGWSAGNVLGGLLLGAVVLGLLVYWVSVTRRR